MLRFLLLALLLGLSAGGVLAQETRVALVIGNSAYSGLEPLPNPARDAAAVAGALREAGFQTVQLEQDLDRGGLLQAFRRFELVAEKADWALVYYAGHGLEVAGTNYLLPVNPGPDSVTLNPMSNNAMRSVRTVFPPLKG